MSQLFVVRHGQASFFADNYDQLSPLGERQSTALGQYWASRGLRFDAVYTGPCVRHRETARLVGEALQAAGLDWPAPREAPGWDEYQAEEVLEAALPKLLETDAEVQRHYRDHQAAVEREDKLRTFQRGYERIMDLWAHGQIETPGVESWSDFCARVHDALADIAANAGGGRRVAVFTSGGPVGVSMQRALELADRQSLRAAWMVRNAAFSEFLFSRERFTLSQYNAHPHLDEPELLTYR